MNDITQHVTGVAYCPAQVLSQHLMFRAQSSRGRGQGQRPGVSLTCVPCVLSRDNLIVTTLFVFWNTRDYVTRAFAISDIFLDDLTNKMFNATLAGHHLRTDYAGSRGGSRAGSRYDLNEVGRHQVNHYCLQWTEHYRASVIWLQAPHSPAYCPHVHPAQLAERITMLEVECEAHARDAPKSCYARYKTCCYLSLVFTLIAATIVIIIFIALGGLRGGSGEGLGAMWQISSLELQLLK